MIYSLTDKVFIGGVVLLFLISLMQCSFMIYALWMWLNNRREQRIAENIRDEQRERIRASNEAHEWMRLLYEKDDRIKQLEQENTELSNKKERVVKLLEKSEEKRLKEVSI